MLESKLDKLLSKEAKKLKTLQFAMQIPELDFEYSYSSTVEDQQFHSASVGKIMTAALIFIAIEKGMIKLDTPINGILDSETISELFVFEGVDYSDKVNIRHLLGHTSGINDYYESKTMDGSTFIDDAIKNSDVFWTPLELLDFTRQEQKAVARPDEKYLYSDTGYILLGLIIEKLFNMPFNRVLETYIFEPLEMKNSGLSFYSAGFDQEKLAPMYINGTDIHLFKSLSCDFSGGGVYTTTKDLLKFLSAFNKGEIIGLESIEKMSDIKNKFSVGLHYGLGMMEVRFKEFFFLLKNLPNLYGHLGVSGAHAWYEPTGGAVYALNVGNTKDMAKSFRLLIKIVQIVEKEKNSR